MTKRKAKAAVIARKELTAAFPVSPYLELEQIQLPNGEWVIAGPDNKPLTEEVLFGGKELPAAPGPRRFTRELFGRRLWLLFHETATARSQR